MKNEIKVPSMGESISEAIVGRILAPTGTLVKADAEIIELETDKVNQVLYAPQAGRVTLSVQPGDTVKIGQVIGSIEAVASQEVPVPKEEPKVVPQSKSTEEPKSIPQTKPEPIPKSAAPETKVVSSSSLEEQALRYTKENFLTDLQTASAPLSAEKISTQEVKPRETRRPLSKIRKVIAKRLVEAQQITAMLTTFNEIDLTEVIQLREKYKETFAKKYGCKLGFMSFFVKAVVSALQAFPDLNSYLEADEIVHREYYDIGVAVGTDKGVIVPVIRHCDQLSYATIERSLEEFAKKAREGSLALADLQGAGFTITNGGVYGSLLSTPILVPPQCGILGMHKIEKRPVAMNDQVVIRPMMYVALSYDHRLIDGKEAVSFLVHMKNMLEDPSRLLLEV